jgi:cytochrome oxidase Cu insertion factor (SCO1/SenC/PrrC family)
MVVNRDGNRAPSGAARHHFIVDCAGVIPIFIGVARDFPVEARRGTQCAAAPGSSAVVLAPSTGPSDHSTYLYVMDPQGKFLQAFDADTPADHIADDLLRLMKPEERPH